MKTPYFLKNNINEQDKKNFEIALITDNIHRGKILAFVVIGFETIYIFIDIITAILKVDSRFEFNEYLAMYSIMIVINMFYLLFVRSFDDIGKVSESQRRKLDTAIVVYITLIMSWGSVGSKALWSAYGFYSKYHRLFGYLFFG